MLLAVNQFFNLTFVLTHPITLFTRKQQALDFKNTTLQHKNHIQIHQTKISRHQHLDFVGMAVQARQPVKIPTRQERELVSQLKLIGTHLDRKFGKRIVNVSPVVYRDGTRNHHFHIQTFVLTSYKFVS